MAGINLEDSIVEFLVQLSFVWIWWIALVKLGYSVRRRLVLCLLSLVPGFTIVMAVIVVFATWPIEAQVHILAGKVNEAHEQTEQSEEQIKQLKQQLEESQKRLKHGSSYVSKLKQELAYLRGKQQQSSD